jgi:NOL1/NOP2/fmu family ribosome biogenesis protein
VDEWHGEALKVQVASKQIQSIAAPFLKKQADYLLSDYKEIVIASLKKWAGEIGTVSKVLQVRKSGVAVGTIKGKDLVPHHELVLSDLLATDIPVFNVEKYEALKYLRRQDLAAETGQKGWTVIRHGDISLGWVKVLPNRVNNYYPTNWRILKS